jgi:two-component sensor histidine kinase
MRTSGGRRLTTMRYLISILCFCNLGVHSAIAQIYASVRRCELVKKLQQAREDSSRLGILLDLTNSYIKGNMPDSALMFVAPALTLSRKLDRSEDFNQESFFACKANAMRNDFAAARAIVGQSTGEWKIKMLQELEEQYAFRPGNYTANLDSAWPYIQWFVNYSDTVHTLWAIQNSRIVLGKYFFQRGETQKGIDLFYLNIKDDQVADEKSAEARHWSMLADNLPTTFATSPLKIKGFTNAIRLFEAAGDHTSALYSLEELAIVHWQAGLFQLADSEEVVASAGLQALKRKMYVHYFYHAVFLSYLGDHPGALDYLFKAKKEMDSLKQDYFAGFVDKAIGEVYWSENDIDKSLFWYRQSLREIQGRKDRLIYGDALRIAACLTLQHKFSDARSFLTDFEKENPEASSRDKEMLTAAWGRLYEAEGLTDQAETTYLEMIRYYHQSIVDQDKDIESDYDVATPEANYTIGKFYVTRGQFTKAQPFLEQALQPESVVPVKVDIYRDTHLLLYVVDSAAGDLSGAIRHRLLYEKLSDSIFSASKFRELAELQVRFETDKKDRDIALLSKQEALHKAELSRAELLRNITIGSLLGALAIIGLLYNQYRVKQRINRAIGLKNEALSQLLNEKEWLLKEVHHRVKNNLQTVVSLLESQSGYLSADALNAIQDSRNRVFSISLIHQKLYQEHDVRRLNIASYLSDLIRYLRDVFGIRSQIAFELNLAPITLEVSQAVSIGLILNEAITNAIKHAFPGRNKGNLIVIAMAIEEDNIVDLTISDNGTGLRAGGAAERGSLGLKLMKGLTADLGGSFSIGSNQGTTINIRFVANTSFDQAMDIILSENSAKRI